MVKVLNFGSLNIDYVYHVDEFVRPGETKLSSQMQIFAGGKGLNQSIALQKAGVPVFHAGNAGDTAEFLIDTLSSYGIDTRYILRSQHKTGHAIIQVDAKGENCILLFGGSNHHIEREQVRSVLSQFENGDILLLQNEINMMPFLVKTAKQRGMYIFLNPAPVNDAITQLDLSAIHTLLVNEIELQQVCRLLVADNAADGAVDNAADGAADNAADGAAGGVADNAADGAAGGAADNAADGAADNAAGGGRLHKSNQEAIESALHSNNIERIAQELQNAYPSMRLLVTLGSNGGFYLGSSGKKTVYSAQKSEQIDSTAAGDTFIGYFIAEWKKGHVVADCLNFAAQAAAVAVRTMGAALSIPSRAEVLQAYPPS